MTWGRLCQSVGVFEFMGGVGGLQRAQRVNNLASAGKIERVSEGGGIEGIILTDYI